MKKYQKYKDKISGYLNEIKDEINGIKDVVIETKAESLLAEYNRIFSGNDLTWYYNENNPEWIRYTEERGCCRLYGLTVERTGYSPPWSKAIKRNVDASEENIFEYFKEFVKMKKEEQLDLTDSEIIELAAIFDQVDYEFAPSIVIYPIPLEDVKCEVFKDSLPRMVNSLVREFGGNPFETEERIKSMYEDFIHINSSWRYLYGIHKRLQDGNAGE
ncbi:MAG: hypothetical protein KAT28_02620 [Candidatus Aenigmarchaeota archaeon]|nr:hypothetical protein [Candidatus Aenigmarchaeota archaeon]